MKAFAEYTIKVVNDGANGKGVSSTTVYYYLSTSNTTQTGGVWTTSPPAWVEGCYYWQKIATTYTDGTATESTPVCIGANGTDGRSVAGITTEYYLSTSSAAVEGGEWSATAPAWEQNKFLWTRTKIEYTNPEGTEYSAAICDSSWLALVDGLKDTFTNFERLETELSNTKEEITALASRELVEQSDFDTFKENIELKVTQTAESVTTEFTKAEERITEVETDFGKRIESVLKELNAYIRYYMSEEGKPVIELGAGSSDIICKILNDRISFTENGIEVAYISDNQLYITNATILSRLNIGNMSFLRRKNGNLSLVLNGG